MPVFSVTLLLNVVLAILARIAPQMNMFVVGIQVKVLVGLILLLILLLLRVLKIDHIREKSDFLLGNLPFFFIPAVVSIMNYVDVIAKNLVPFLVICVVSLVLTYGATAWAVQLTMKLMKKGGEKK